MKNILFILENSDFLAQNQVPYNFNNKSQLFNQF